MKHKLLLAVVLAVTGMLLAGAGAHYGAEKKGKPRYVHVVVFTLKKDAPKDAAATMTSDCHDMLAKIPSVRELRAGTPAEKATPNLAKKDYSVALTIFFDDYDGLMAYDRSELHQKFVQKHLPHVDLEKLLVFDYEDQAK
jgi:hypothetical protein